MAGHVALVTTVAMVVRMVVGVVVRVVVEVVAMGIAMGGAEPRLVVGDEDDGDERREDVFLGREKEGEVVIGKFQNHLFLVLLGEGSCGGGGGKGCG